MPTLSPWEQRNSYYKGLELGKDVKALTSTLNRQTKSMISGQLASANAVIVSQERLVESQKSLRMGIDAVEIGIDRVCEGIYGLQATFEWGIGEIVWQIEQNREILKSILEVLSAPLDTQAKELRKRAEEAYQNAWIDDALADFLESEIKNRYDFTVHISLGNIYLFHKEDKTKALEYFEKAIKYAKPKSDYHTSYSLLHKGVIKYSEQKYQEALACVEEVIKLTPNLMEAHFQKAQYLAALGKQPEMLRILEQTILMDKYYCLKVENTDDFKTYMDCIYQLINNLKDGIATKIQTRLPQLTSNHNILSNLNQQKSINCYTPEEIEKFNLDIDKLKNYLKKNSYFDMIDAQKSFPEVVTFQINIYKKIKNKIDSKISSLKSLIEKGSYVIERYEKGDYKEGYIKPYPDYGDSQGATFGKIFAFLGFIVSAPYVANAGHSYFIAGIPGALLGWFITFMIYSMFKSNYISQQKSQLRKEAKEKAEKATREAEEAETELNSFNNVLKSLNGYKQIPQMS